MQIKILFLFAFISSSSSCFFLSFEHTLFILFIQTFFFFSFIHVTLQLFFLPLIRFFMGCFPSKHTRKVAFLTPFHKNANIFFFSFFYFLFLLSKFVFYFIFQKPLFLFTFNIFLAAK